MSKSSGKKRSLFMKVLMTIGIFLIVLVVAMGAILLATEGTRQRDRDIEVADVDFSAVPDGTYRGSYEGWNKFDVLVTVEDGAVVDMVITDDSKNPETEVTRGVFDDILSEQSLDVDAVSGATITTNALLKAVEDALVSQRTP